MYKSQYLASPKKSSTQPTTIKQNQSLDTYLRKKSEEYFFKLASQELTQQQMKVQFSKDILTAFLTSIPADIMSQKDIQDMEEHLRENVIFLKTLYPLPKISVINKHLFQKLKEYDYSDKVEYDLLANLDFQYQVKDKNGARTQILSQTQSLLNSLITSAQRTILQFTNLLMTQIPKKLSPQSKQKYQNLMKQSSKFDLENDISKTNLYNKDLVSENLFFPSLELFKVIYDWVDSLEGIVEEPEKYFDRVEYLKALKRKKIQQIKRGDKGEDRIFGRYGGNKNGSGANAHLVTESVGVSQSPSQVSTTEQPSFFTSIVNKIKSFCSPQQPIQQKSLQKITANYRLQLVQQHQLPSNEPTIENTQNFSNYQFKQSGYLMHNFSESLQELNEQVQYRKFCQEQLEFLRRGYIQTIRVVDKNKNKQKYTIEEKKVYSFCQNSYYFMEEVVIDRLIKLIQSFMLLKQKSQSQYQKSMVFQDIDLIKFNQSSAISAYIIADDKLINCIYNAICQLASRRQAKIAKIQNRFGTSSNDAIILLKMKNNPILCKLRLVLETPESGPQAKQKALGQMNRFLTDIEECSFGPISYLSLILATKDFRVNYLKSIKRHSLEGGVRLAQVCHCGKGNVSQRSSVNTFEKQIKSIISQNGTIKLDCYRNLIPSSFVCGVCEKVLKKGQCVIPVPNCTDCGFHICVQCSFQNSPEAQKSIYVMLINSVARIVDPCYFSQLQIVDENKKSYNHSFTKDVQVLVNGRVQIKKQIYYHIMLQPKNFVRYSKNSRQDQFWSEVKQKINLKIIPEYENVIKMDKFIGIIFRPRQLLRAKGQPFVFIGFNSKSNQFSKYSLKPGEQSAVENLIKLQEIKVSQNDVFVPILWVFGESLVSQYITKVLQTNPFYVKKVPIRQIPIDHMRFSRSKISSHHIMR